MRAELPLSSLADAVGASPNPSAVEQHLDGFLAYVSDRLRIAQGDNELTLRASGYDTVQVNTGNFLSIPFEPITLTQPTGAFDVRYSLFFDREPTHRGVLLVQPHDASPDSEEGKVSLIFSPDRTRQMLNLENADELEYSIRRSGGGFARALPLAAGGIFLSMLVALVLGTMLNRLRSSDRGTL